MENQNKLIIIIMIIFVLFTSSVIISQHTNNNHNNSQKTLMSESIYKYNTINILKLNIGNKTIYLYDNNFTVINNPNIIHILNSSVKPLFVVNQYTTNQHYYEFFMAIQSNIPIANLPFFQSGTNYLICGIINFFNNNNSLSFKGLFQFYSDTGLDVSGTTNQLKFSSLSMQNQYIFYYSGSTLNSIYLNNFIYSKNFYNQIINGTHLSDTVIFGQKNQYIVNFHSYYSGVLTITNSTISNTYNNIKNYSVLLNNGSYSFKFIYIKNNNTYYNNGSFNVYGNNSLNIILSTNGSIPFSYSLIFFLILLIITSLIIMFYIKNYWLLLINILIILAIGISENIHIISFAYVLLIALFLSVYIGYRVSLKGDFE